MAGRFNRPLLHRIWGQIQRAPHALALVIDDRDVVWFQMLYYFIFCTAGVYGIFVAGSEPPLTLGSLPILSVHTWYWMNIIGPAMGLAGIAVERNGREFPGVWMQIGGNVMFGWALMTYMTTTFGVESWGRGMYGAYPLATASFASTTFLVIRDLRWVFVPAARVRSRPPS
jgi:hypothetical protein